MIYKNLIDFLGHAALYQPLVENAQIHHSGAYVIL